MHVHASCSIRGLLKESGGRSDFEDVDGNVLENCVLGGQTSWTKKIFGGDD